MMKEKIKDIYSCRPLYENHPLYGSDPLVVWHENAEQFIRTYDWQCDEDKIEFEQSVERLYDKIYLQNER